MRAIILCAGKGSRLAGLADEVPKTLLQVTSDKTIFDTIFESVEPLVEEIVVVAGHCKEALIEYTASLPRTSVVSVENVDRWNNARSLWCALQGVDDDVLVANGDTVLHPSATRDLVESSAQFDVALALDSSVSLAEEEMKVVVDSAGLVRHISKEVDPTTAIGEYVGQSVINRGCLSEVTSCLEKLWSMQPNGYYEDGYQIAIDRGISVGTVEIPIATWSEVDDQRDLAEARGLPWL